MTKQCILYLCCLVFVFNGCIQDVEVDFEDKHQTYVLNGILYANRDTITVWLTKSRPLASTNEFNPVEAAQITLFEEGQKVGDFTPRDSSAYTLAYQPLPGKLYRMEIHADDHVIWAETTVPSPPIARIQYENNDRYSGNYEIELADIQEESNFYWVSATGFEGSSDNRTKNIACAIFSNFIYADDFNQRVAEIGYYGVEYEYYMRFTDHEIQGKTARIIFTPACISYPEEVFILSVDNHLDKYMKSSLLQKDMDLLSGEIPLAYSPSPIYSNIHGGTGIFGSVNSASKIFTQDDGE